MKLYHDPEGMPWPPPLYPDPSTHPYAGTIPMRRLVEKRLAEEGVPAPDAGEIRGLVVTGDDRVATELRNIRILVSFIAIVLLAGLVVSFVVIFAAAHPYTP